MQTIGGGKKTRKARIFYCDDSQQNLDRFVENHEEEFDIVPLIDFARFQGELTRLTQRKRTAPDIILIDLFHPKVAPTAPSMPPPSPESVPLPPHEATPEQLVPIGKQAMQTLSKQIGIAKVHIYNAWDHTGMTLLEQARAIPQCSDTPIAIYTEQGLYVVGDDVLVRASDLRATWLLKGHTREYESSRLNAMWAEAKRKRTAKKSQTRRLYALLLLFFAVFIGAVACGWAMGPEVDSRLSLLVAVGVAMMPLLIEAVVEKWHIPRGSQNG